MPCVMLEPSGFAAPRPPFRWPEGNRDAIRAVLENDQTLVDLWELSPYRFDSNKPVTELIIDNLFPTNPLLCCGWEFRRWRTTFREDWRGHLSQMQFIVPSPMITKKGRTAEGKLGYRSLANTGRRRFLVVEFDFREPIEGVDVGDASAGLLLHLPIHAPLALVVHSGGKSLHGWFYCAGQPEEKLWKFMSYAVSLGADHMTWTPCQSVRMPDGLRNNGKRQRVFYFNPEVVK